MEAARAVLKIVSSLKSNHHQKIELAQICETLCMNSEKLNFIPGCVTCIGGLGLAGYLDMTSTGYPAWFRGLRFVLTFVAIITLSTSLICKMILDEEKEETGVKEVEKKKEESK